MPTPGLKKEKPAKIAGQDFKNRIIWISHKEYDEDDNRLMGSM